MISAIETIICNVVLHRVGNKLRDENYLLSKKQLHLYESIKDDLINYFVLPFTSDEYYQLYHDSGIEYNVVYGAVNMV